MPDGNELQAIKGLEDELREAQQIEVLMGSIDGRNPVQRIVDGFAASSLLYTNKKELSKMVGMLEGILSEYVKKANIKGKLLAGKELDKYFEKAEKRITSARQLRLINIASDRQAKRRLNVSLLEIEKEKNVLSYDIRIFRERAKVAGFTDKEALKQLVVAGKNKDGLAQGFAKRIKSVNVAAVRRENSAAEIAEYEKKVSPKELWQWISISSKPCPDCEARAGRVMTLSEWQRLGTPGAGRTICGRHCRCKLIPFKVAEEKFPTVKVFDWNKKDLVLTTASEARQLQAFKNQARQETKK